MKEKYRLDPKTGEFVECMTETGQEIPDPVPMAPPVGFKRQQPLHERIRAMVQHEYLRASQKGEVETPEEADDFVVGDEDDPRYGERFALMPGHEHDWEENYNPPKDFKEMKERLIAAGWKAPPEKGQEVSAEKPAKSDASAKPLDASQAPKVEGVGAKPA